MWVYFYARPQQNIFPEFLHLLQRERHTRGDRPLTYSHALNQIQSHISNWEDMTALQVKPSHGKIQNHSEIYLHQMLVTGRMGTAALPPQRLLNLMPSYIQYHTYSVFSFRL